ncbi:MAG: A/G-specific adenine glycosylase, partial [Terriglobales bacterium]
MAMEVQWLRRRLLEWYGRERRRLPWRAAPGAAARHSPRRAYRVWVSEVMLQQTQVATVIPYYRRFLRRFATVAELAAAGEAEVLAHWSGLGYYRRARQLQAAARLICAQHGGEFPRERGAAEGLPGVGRYTAAAVLSMAYGEPLAAMDANGMRVARRLLGRVVTPAEAQRALDGWLAPGRAGDFNQAVMDLGATVCRPRAP